MFGKDTPETRKPKYSRFTQQELPACRLLLTPTVVIYSLLAIGAVFIPLGAVSLQASSSVVEVVLRYDDTCLGPLTPEQRDQAVRQGGAGLCDLGLTVPRDMNPPIFLYYQLTNFYQNYRRYVRSQSEAQLSGSNVTDSGLDVCQPQAGVNGSTSVPIVPCGLIAWSLFNDTFALAQGQANLTGVPIDSSAISWPSDRNYKFSSSVFPQNFNSNPATRGGKELPVNQSLADAQDLQVWMRTAALPTFRKLYGQINEPLTAGSVLNVRINNLYNSYAYGGTKSVVLSTASWLGGKNDFLGIAYLTVGGICLALAIVFFVLQFTHRRPLGDTSYLSWNKKAAAEAAAAHPAAATATNDSGMHTPMSG